MRNWVYDVARRLGVRTKVVQGTMMELGYIVKSASTPMTDEEVKAVTAKLSLTSVRPDEVSEPDTTK